MAKRPPAKKRNPKEVADRAEARSKKNQKADTLPKTASGKTSAQPLNADGLSSIQRAVNKGYKLPSENDLRNLMRQCKKGTDEKDAAVGFIREKIGYAVEHKSLHAKAFADIRKMDKMEAEKLADYWHTLLAYMDMTGITEKIDSVERLPLPEPTKPGDGEGEQTPGAEQQAQEPAPPTEPVSRPKLSVVNAEQDKIPA